MSTWKKILIFIIVGAVAGAVSAIIGRLIEFEHIWIIASVITAAAVMITGLILTKIDKKYSGK